jgi:anaerobic selenocysteine-containing dehydrogenase
MTTSLTPTTVRGACPHDCPDTCAMLVTVDGGRATAVRGDPDHPFTRGGLCVKVNDYVEHVYSPDRVLYPLRRTGRKGAGEFTRISWDEALDEIAGRFRRIVAEDGGSAILPYSYLGTEGLVNGLTVGDPFFHRLGATISERTFCDSGSCTAYFMTIGPTAGMDPESFAHSRFILLWANNMQSTNLHMWPFVQEAQRRGAKVVVVDPVRTRTARSADWHIPIRPGTDAALALGLINVIVADGLVDRDYVDNHTLGYEELALRAKDYPPARVAEITGVPAADVEKLAREYATTQPAAIRIGVAIERHTGGGQTVRAIACLPALVGAWRRPGGGLLQLPLWAFPMRWDVLSRPDLIGPDPRVVNQWRLGPALTGELGLDPPVRALVVYNSNPVVVAPDQDRVLRGLAREDLFTVVSEQFLTDTAAFADLVLPATTQLEQFDLMFSWGHLYLTLNNPAVAPLGEAVPNAELFRRLAARMGFDDPWFSMTDEQMALAALDWDAPVLEGIDLDRLRRDGWARLNLPPAEAYAPHAAGNFPTASGRCEFVSSLAAAAGNLVVPVFREGYAEQQPGDPVDPVPAYLPVPADGAYPLSLLTPKAHGFLNSQYANMPHQRRVQGEQTVVLHPEDAAARGVADGAAVRVFNGLGEFDAVARVSEEVARGVAVAPLGHWRRGSRSGATVNAVTRREYADLGNAPSFSDTRVEVAPAG